MCVVAVLNGAEYEFIHHAPEFLEAGGTAAQADAVRAMASAPIPAGVFDDLGNAAIALATQMTREVKVDDATFAVLRERLGETGVVELVGVVAAYNMVSRFLVALGVEPE